MVNGKRNILKTNPCLNEKQLIWRTAAIANDPVRTGERSSHQIIKHLVLGLLHRPGIAGLLALTENYYNLGFLLSHYLSKINFLMI